MEAGDPKDLQGRAEAQGMTIRQGEEDLQSSHCRMASHLKGQLAKSESNPLYRHDRDHHDGQVQDYKMRILHRESKILPLSIMEALYIEAQSPGSTMNERNEYGRGSLVRMVASRGVG